MKKFILMLFTHGAVGFAGFALGVYLLPILTAPAAPTHSEMRAALANNLYSGTFTKDLPGSDFLHWGEGKLSLSQNKIVFEGELAPGPDYKLYLSPVFVDDEASFEASKAKMVQLSDVKTFNGFVVNVPEGVDVGQYSTAVVWCETFAEFISAAKYQN